MENLPRTLLRFLLISAAAFLAFTSPWLFIPMGLTAGLLFAKVMDDPSGAAARARRQARKEMKMQKQAERQAVRQAALDKERYYSRKEGWKAESLPYDVSLSLASLSQANPRRVDLEVAGMKGLAYAVSAADGTLFYLKLRDQDAVAKAEKAIRDGKLPAKIVRSAEDGGLRVVTDSPEVLSSVAKDVYPSREASWSREVTHSRQYIVEGCSSYDEAVGKLRSDPASYKVCRSFVDTKETVDGKASETRMGRPLDSASVISLPTGAYVVTESTLMKDSAVVRIPGDLRDDESVRRFAGARVAAEAGRAEPQKSVSYSDGTPQGVRAGTEVLLSPVDTPAVSSLLDGGLKAYVVVDTPEQAASIARGGVLPADTLVSLGRDVPLMEGKYTVSVDIDGVGDLLRLRSIDGGGRERDYEEMASELGRTGRATAVVGEPLSLAGGRVNGVLPAAELADRVSNPRLEKLESAELGSWIRDASKIESVRITANQEEGTLTVVSVVGGSMRRETIELSEGQLQSLVSRGKVGVAEMKDLLMQTNPAFFSTYRAVRSSSSVPVRSVYKNPVEDFLKGRKPERALTVRNVIRDAKQKRNMASEVRRGGVPGLKK